MNAAHQSAVAHLKERMSAHPRAVLVAVEIEHLKQLDSLITELEADGKRLDWMDDYEAHANDHGRILFTVYEIPPFTQRKDKDLRQAIDAAMKGA